MHLHIKISNWLKLYGFTYNLVFLIKIVVKNI